MTKTKKFVTFTVHSFVDVITNSSTELFVGNTNKTREKIMEILELATKLSNVLKEGSNYQVQDIIDLNQITRINVKHYVKLFFDWGFPNFVRTNEFSPAKSSLLPHEYSDSEIDDWIEHNPDVVDQLVGLWVIEGTEDNSIPFELFDIIEDIFEENSDRKHLG